MQGVLNQTPVMGLTLELQCIYVCINNISTNSVGPKTDSQEDDYLYLLI